MLIEKSFTTSYEYKISHSMTNKFYWETRILWIH